YDSLHNKIIPLADDIIVYPAHGAGSACGKNMSKETTDTLGNQKKTNYALQPMSKEKFIDEVLDGLMPPPGYFPENVLMNIKGYESIDEVLHKGTQALSPEARSEEHTSELQSREKLVCRLLLEKKKDGSASSQALTLTRNWTQRSRSTYLKKRIIHRRTLAIRTRVYKLHTIYLVTLTCFENTDT